VTGFEFNEDLKDCCLLLGAETAVTAFFKNGVTIMPDPFYETHIVFAKEFKPEDVALAVKSIRAHLNQLELNKIECTDIVMESKKGILRLIYSIFCSEKKFTTKQLKYIED
jgi:hypothetical protein